jgi:hypothetical protein
MNIQHLLALVSCSCASLVLVPSAGVCAPSTFTSDDDRFAWSANLGWIEFRPERPAPGDGVRVHDSFLAGYAWSANAGWIHFGNGSPANALRYENTTGLNYGVNHNGTGDLRGFAWSSNLGWIHFGWASGSDAQRPRFSVASGEFSGYAWSPNAGWISLGTGHLRTDAISVPDSDGDGISDTWEIQHAGSLPVLSAQGDADADGVPDGQEYVLDTDPLVGTPPLRITSIVSLAGQSAVAVEWPSRPSRVYVVEGKPDLGQPDWLALGTVPGGLGSNTVVAIERGAPEAFFRIGAKLPLTP